MSIFSKLAEKLGRLVQSKQEQYGDSAGKSAKILSILYPSGISLLQYSDALLVVRIIDKLSRISQRTEDGLDKGGESPFTDIAGYGLLGMAKDGD